ncbi:hypothetical protein SS50377_23163 [Spironucleus salmonicida]|uniref:Uncharacterized protein n=1 Tax=Spironucleus salmonicida TaxID=348837 RepID=V6LB92_9EUKA|nr:hypothetical protein SS50377_23163 [Spironucleus salmonicida]|eukprot:EST41662.1 Hypothetical protein SS50377_18750 [Spironucleus salmonicida]
MSIRDLPSYRMVAKLVLQQQGDDAEQSQNVHFVPQIQSICFHQVLTSLALVANQQSIFVVEAVAPDLAAEKRVLQQFQTPSHLIIKQAIFCSSLQYVSDGFVQWKPDLFVAVIYNSQRLLHIIDPVQGTVLEANLPFVPNQIIATTSPAASRQQYLLPQAVIAIGEKSFAVIAIHDQPGFLNSGELQISVTEVILPAFGAAAGAEAPNVQFGPDPDQIFIQHGNFLYKYKINAGQPKEDHDLDIKKFREDWRQIDKSKAEIKKHEMTLNLLAKLWSPAEKCELLKIFQFQTNKILNFKFSKDHEKLAILTHSDIQIFKFDSQNGNLGKIIKQFPFNFQINDLKFVPKFSMKEQDLTQQKDIDAMNNEDSDDFDIFQEVEKDCSSISIDQEISTGEEFKQLIEQVDNGNDIQGGFDMFLSQSEIVNLKSKKSVKLVNQLRQHPHLYQYFKNIYLSGNEEEVLLQSEIVNFGQNLIFTEDDKGIMIRPNIFSGFIVFNLDEKEDYTVTKLQWQPINISSMQDYQQKKCAEFVPGQNIFILGVGNALYISAKQ